jgi:hypothetical protein
VKARTFTLSEAATLARFFAALERQVGNAQHRGDDALAAGLSRLFGRLQYMVFGGYSIGDTFGAEGRQ